MLSQWSFIDAIKTPCVAQELSRGSSLNILFYVEIWPYNVTPTFPRSSLYCKRNLNLYILRLLSLKLQFFWPAVFWEEYFRDFVSIYSDPKSWASIMPPPRIIIWTILNLHNMGMLLHIQVLFYFFFLMISVLQQFFLKALLKNVLS